jgi:tricorn protease
MRPLLILTISVPLAAADALPTFYEPSLSPDGAEIAFVSGGDIWTVPARGGEARLLVSHSANEGRPLYSPDGKRLAFNSNRTGNGDIYLLTFATGEVKRLTFDDGNDQLDAWSRDGKWIYFSSASRDISGMNDIFRVSAEGGTPMQVSADRYTSEFYAAPAPDGNTLAFAARGMASQQWWRKGHSHLDESEIWLRREGAPAVYERVSEGGAKELWPMWGRDGRTLYYVSDRGGAQNIWTRPPGGRARQVTRFEDGRVLWPNISYDGRSIVFERDFRIWKMDTETGKAALVPITRRGAPAGGAPQHLSLTTGFRHLALSPDGKKVAFVAHGDVFAASAGDGGDALRVTRTPANESQIAWSPDSRRLVYVSDRAGVPNLFLYDFSSNTETQLTHSASDAAPHFSPDGKAIAFEREGRELRVLELESKQERTVATGVFDRPPLSPDHPIAWSPDSKWIAYISVAGKLFQNIYVAPAAGSGGRPVSFLANGNSNTIAWSPDGAFLLFDTGQRTENGQLARVDLIPRTPKFREDQFRDLFKDEKPKTSGSAEPKPASAEQPNKAEKKPVEIVFDGIKQRLSLLPVGMDISQVAISADGKSALLEAGAAGQQNLYTWSLDELAKEPPVARQLTSTSGFKRDPQFSPDGKQVYYVEGGRIQVMQVESRQAKPVAVTAEMDVDFDAEKEEVFRQAWTYLRDNFFDEKFNGVDWEAVRKQYSAQVAGARTQDELRRLLSLMVGELNASHLGVSATLGPPQPTTGRIGLRFDRTEYESSGKLRVTEVIRLSPAAVSGKIKPGDYLTAVDGITITAHTNVDELLEHKVGRRVVLSLEPEKREVAVQPVSQATEKGLVYRQWVNDNRDYVTRASGGKLGYVHMLDMSSTSLERLFVDLDAENHSRAGVIVDVRNNSGGFVNAYALDVLARRPYMTMTERGRMPAPARTVLGQRALEAPTILVTNQHSLSDAEDFTEGYRTLKLGKVVGEPTAGWIIYTSGTQLIDGTVLRLPTTRITAHDGTPMEMHPRPVDIAVSRPIGESYTGKDSQLDAAVRELLKELNGRE